MQFHKPNTYLIRGIYYGRCCELNIAYGCPSDRQKCCKITKHRRIH